MNKTAQSCKRTFSYSWRSLWGLLHESFSFLCRLSLFRASQAQAHPNTLSGRGESFRSGSWEVFFSFSNFKCLVKAPTSFLDFSVIFALPVKLFFMTLHPPLCGHSAVTNKGPRGEEGVDPSSCCLWGCCGVGADKRKHPTSTEGRASAESAN